MRVLYLMACPLVVLALCCGADAALMHDDFSTDTSGNYTRIASLARTGSRLPAMTIAGGELTVSTVGTGHGSGSTGVTQTHILHNTGVLGVGETLLLDIDLLGSDFGTNVSEVIGITVVGEGDFPGIVSVPPGSNQDVRDSQVANIHVGVRNGRDGIEGLGRIRTDVFDGPAGADPDGSEVTYGLGMSSDINDPDLAKITSLFIARYDTDEYAMGWIENGIIPHVLRTVNVDLGDDPRVGIYTDTRNSNFNQRVDNFRIVAQVPEPGTIALTTLAMGILGLIARKK